VVLSNSKNLINRQIVTSTQSFFRYKDLVSKEAVHAITYENMIKIAYQITDIYKTKNELKSALKTEIARLRKPVAR